MVQNGAPKWAKILLICLTVALLLGCAVWYLALRSQDGGNQNNGVSATEPTPMGIGELVDTAMTLKTDLKEILNSLRASDFPSAHAQVRQMSQKVQRIRASALAVEKVLGGVPGLGAEIRKVTELLDLADLAMSKLLEPGLAYVAEHPLSQLRVGDGINTALVWGYIDLAESMIPDLKALMARLDTVDLSMVDEEGKLTEYLDMANAFLEVYREDPTVLAKLKTFLGADGDRVYLMAAQNSAEIRASGGFPGAMGKIRIQDGILTLQDFKTINEMMYYRTPMEAAVTSLENKLFHRAMNNPRDADYCPDFERVGYIWAIASEVKTREHVDGVISMTPALVQKILKVLGKEIVLFDGSILDGDNAAKVLQRDIYFQYFVNKDIKDKHTISDDLFTEAAKLTMDIIMDNMGPGDLLKYIKVARHSFQDRTLMIWMEDPDIQAVLRKLNWHGGLNRDPLNPQAGIYYNLTLASKMGWFLTIDTEMGQREKNEDGSYTYPITVIYRNTITAEERGMAELYILGNYMGFIQGSAYFFAPAGGTISEVETDARCYIQYETYQDLQLAYINLFNVLFEDEVVVTYSVTTAPGVETELVFSKTPAAQDCYQWDLE